MLYSDLLKQQQAVLDKRFSGNANMVKVKDSRFQSGYGWMPKGMADGTDHTKYYNAAQAWRAGGRVGKYTPPNLRAGETQGRIGSYSPRRSSSHTANKARLYRQAQEKKRQAMQKEREAAAAAAAAAKAQQAAQQRKQRIAQQGRAIGDFINFGGGGMSSMPSQNFYRPYRPPAPRNDQPSARQKNRRESQPRGASPGSSLFQQAMLRGFRPPSQNPSRAVRQRSPRMSAAGRRQRSGDVNSPAAYFNNRFQRTDFPSYSRMGRGY